MASKFFAGVDSVPTFLSRRLATMIIYYDIDSCIKNIQSKTMSESN